MHSRGQGYKKSFIEVNQKVLFQEKDTEKNHKRCYILKRKVITVKNGKNKM